MVFKFKRTLKRTKSILMDWKIVLWIQTFAQCCRSLLLACELSTNTHGIHLRGLATRALSECTKPSHTKNVLIQKSTQSDRIIKRIVKLEWAMLDSRRDDQGENAHADMNMQSRFSKNKNVYSALWISESKLMFNFEYVWPISWKHFQSFGINLFIKYIWKWVKIKLPNNL